MRFYEKRKHREEIVRTWFAWWPVTINDETRWLENISVRGYWLIVSYEWYWISKEFVD